MYRYNFGYHFFLHGDACVLMSGEERIEFLHAHNLYEFLVYCALHYLITDEIRAMYHISDTLREVLCTYGVCEDISTTKTGCEAYWFHAITKQPNKLDIDYSAKQISHIYQRAKEIGLYPSVNTHLCTEYDLSAMRNKKYRKMLDASLSLGSTRSLIREKDFDDMYFLTTMYHAFLKKKGKPLLRGSAGGWYSIFLVTITHTDTVYIVHPLVGKIYQTNAQGIYQKMKGVLVPTTNYTLDGYGALVLCLCDADFCFKKYGNRGYRYLMMESGAIGLLLRLYYASRGYLEVGGYYDNSPLEVLKEYVLFPQMPSLLLTHLLLVS